MFVGNICYVTSSYNEDRFRILLEMHLSNQKGAKLNNALIEQCLAALLECKNSDICKNDIANMEHLIKNVGIKYSDHRDYGAEKLHGDPKDAVRIFNKLMKDYLNQLDR